MSSDASSTRSVEDEEDESSSQRASHHKAVSPSRRSVRKRKTNHDSSQNGNSPDGRQYDPDLDDIFGGAPIVFNDRHSDSSVYEPSVHTSSPLSTRNHDPPHPDPESGSDFATPSRKRTFSGRNSLASSDLSPHPSKRSKPTAPLNHAYLALLNTDIEDARARYVPNSHPPLHTSQIGLTVWTPPEKELFFEALGRLGRDDAPGIAARMGGSKGELEVRQYLMLLRDAVEAKRAAGELQTLAMVEMPAAAELSVKCCFALDEAAEGVSLRVEGWEGGREEKRWSGEWKGVITVEDCVESEEEEVEEEGQGNHEVKAEPSDREGGVDEDIKEQQGPPTPAELFHLQTFLRLSSRLFMNAPFPDGNWASHSPKPPSIRTTALYDLHSLTLSILRRLMSASLYIARSRIRSKTTLMPWTRSVVRKRDVRAAAKSIGLQTDARVGWVRLARRLKLRVYENPPLRREEAEEEACLRYREVEDELSKRIERYAPSYREEWLSSFDETTEEKGMGGADGGEEEMSSTFEDEPEDIDPKPGLDDGDDIDDGHEDLSYASESSGPTSRLSSRPRQRKKQDPVLWATARAEAAEIINHSAVGFPATWDARKILTRRIISEMKREVYADDQDRIASIAEESRMWALLGSQPPEELPDKEKRKGKGKDKGIAEEVLPPKKRADVRRADVEELVWPGGGGGRDWRDRIEWRREWESETGADQVPRSQ